MTDFTLDGEIAVLTLDDGKVNAVGHTLIDNVNYFTVEPYTVTTKDNIVSSLIGA